MFNSVLDPLSQAPMRSKLTDMPKVPPEQHPVCDGDPLEEGEEEELFEEDEEEAEEEEEEEEEEPPPNKQQHASTKGQGKGKKAKATAKGTAKAKAQANKVKAKATGPGAKPKPAAKKAAKNKGPAAKPQTQKTQKTPQGKGLSAAPATPDDSKPSVNFKDAMSKYQNSPRRRQTKIKAEQAAEEEPTDPQAVQRKMWNRFDRSLQAATQRQGRAPKAPARIRDAIMSAPDSGVRIDFFKLYCECYGDWGKVEAKHKKRESTKEGHGSRKRWLMLSQMIKLYESQEVALAMKALCMSEEGCWRHHPKLKMEISDQFLIEVEDDEFYDKFNEDERTYTASGTLDMPSASRIAHGAESGAAPPQLDATGAEDEEEAEGGEAEAVAKPKGRRKGAGGMPVDPTLQARKAAAATKSSCESEDRESARGNEGLAEKRAGRLGEDQDSTS